MARIVLSTFGSLGDLRPYIAIARELKGLGHAPVVATHAFHRAEVESAGVAFYPVRPDVPAAADRPRVLAALMDERRGSEYVMNRCVLPFVRESFDDLVAACDGGHLIVSHVLSVTAPLVAETLHLPRVHTVLQPYTLFSAHDPPVVPGMSWWRPLGPVAWKPLWWAARLWSRPWFHELDTLRTHLGLPGTARHPFMDLAAGVPTLALFSATFAAPQPDWPRRCTVVGFPFVDDDDAPPPLPAELSRFLDHGPEPIVFTLGSSGPWAAGRFFDHAIQAARDVGHRAVIIAGPEAAGSWPRAIHPGLCVVEAASHAALFPRAALVVHHGGIGTTAETLRAGKPAVIVPFAHDQPDNAARCERLGLSITVSRRGLGAARLSRAIENVMAEVRIAKRCAALATHIRSEHCAQAAARRIASVLGEHAAAEHAERAA